MYVALAIVACSQYYVGTYIPTTYTGVLLLKLLYCSCIACSCCKYIGCKHIIFLYLPNPNLILKCCVNVR